MHFAACFNDVIMADLLGFFPLPDAFTSIAPHAVTALIYIKRLAEKRRYFVGALPDRGIILVFVCAVLDCRDFLCCRFALCAWLGSATRLEVRAKSQLKEVLQIWPVRIPPQRNFTSCSDDSSPRSPQCYQAVCRGSNYEMKPIWKAVPHDLVPADRGQSAECA